MTPEEIAAMDVVELVTSQMVKYNLVTEVEGGGVRVIDKKFDEMDLNRLSASFNLLLVSIRTSMKQVELAEAEIELGRLKSELHDEDLKEFRTYARRNMPFLGDL